MTSPNDALPETGGEEVLSPATWDVQTLRHNLTGYLTELADEHQVRIPVKRLQVQLEQNTDCREVLRRWPDMDGRERLEAWKTLLGRSQGLVEEPLPVCIKCGECCRKGSPTLHVEDLDLLREGKIAWNQLVTLRRGEPVQSPFHRDLCFLLDERIKFREKPGSQECVFLDPVSDQCSIYVDRPIQCRAQACWDPSVAEQLREQSYLTRRDLFGDVEILLEVIADHDRRCGFEKFRQVVDRLARTKGESIEELLEQLSFEEHFRHFMGERLSIPEDTLDLVFGRSLEDLVTLFGLRVEQEAEGGKRLVPESDPGKE